MKTLNHVHLGALNVVRSTDFYCKHLGFEKVADHGEGVFLKNAQGFLIAIDPVEELELPGWFHIGFCQDSPDGVRAVHASMEADGVEFHRPLTEYGDDALVFYALDPAGTKIEVSWHKE